MNARNIAKLVSNILNPFLIGAISVFLLTYSTTAAFTHAMRWWAITVGTSILPVVLILSWLVYTGNLRSLFVSIRQQRTEVYLLAAAFTAFSSSVLYLLNAPSTIITGVSAALLGIILLMGINFWWKISVHTAFISALITLLWFRYGWISLAGVSLIVLTGWARVTLKEHTVLQVVGGALLSIVVGVIGFGLRG